MSIPIAIGVSLFLLLGGQSEPNDETKKPAASAPVASSDRDDALKRRLAEIDSRISQVETLKADFEQTKATPLLKKPLLSTGTIAVKGARVRWTTRSPRQSVMTFGAGEIRMFYPQERVVEIYTLPGKFHELSGNPLGQLTVLRSMFRVSQIDVTAMEAPPLRSNEDQYLALELSPLGAELEEHVSMIRVLIDTKVPCLTRIDVYDGDGARTTIKLTNIRVNVDVQEAEVDASVPAGTRESRPFPGHAEEKAAGDQNKGQGK